MAKTGSKKATTNPFWYKDAIIYELHVRSFFDSNADGIGDFPGLTQKLDYLQELGVTAVWLLPFYPSPLKDDGYDIADYYQINPIYGTLSDFRAFLTEAHHRGLRVITELVINHTSDQHGWFQRSRRAVAGSVEREFYVWTQDPERYRETRIIFKDFEPSNWTWDPVAQAYYWHRFYAHQPDLNFDSPHVHAEIFKILDFWLDMGVDGFRLDAIPYLYEREGTSCESLPETHEFIRKLRSHVDEKYGDRLLLAEANQWPEEAVVYFGQGKGDECHMAFHFPLMPRLFMAIRMEDRIPIVDILDQTPAIPETSQWALFLRNHDELTLEMVTDEERDFMYRVYATETKARINLGIRRRLGPLLGNDRKKIELMNMLLLSLPGTPVLYYGDEIGMGDNIFLGDRNGVRTPMHWSSDKNAGFSRANPQALFLPIIVDPEYHYEANNVEGQERNSNSLLWWMRRLLLLRKRWRAFGQGTLEFLNAENRKVLAFIRQFEGETILVVANLSRMPQPVELDLARFRGTVPMELFGRTRFPEITGSKYFLTLGPHSAFWFSLASKTQPVASEPIIDATTLEPLLLEDSWVDVLAGTSRARLEARLQEYLHRQPWFAGGTRSINSVRVGEFLPLHCDGEKMLLCFVSVDYVQGDPELYFVPLALASGETGEYVKSHTPSLIVSPIRMSLPEVDGFICDAVGSKNFGRAMIEMILRQKNAGGKSGQLIAQASESGPGFEAISKWPHEGPMKVDQRNTGILFGEHFFLKLFRRLEVGVNPDLEISQFLTRKKFPNSAKYAGSLEYLRNHGDRITVGLASAVVPDSRNGWDYTVDAFSRYLERVRILPPGVRPPPSPRIGHFGQQPPEDMLGWIGTYASSAELLGQRTAELHCTLAGSSDDKDFAPEPFTPFYQRSLYQSMRNLAVENLSLLRKAQELLPGETRDLSRKLLQSESTVLKTLRRLYASPMVAYRIRCHGDFDLHQILHNGRDFVFIDFEGEPDRPLGERRIKRSPLKDAASMAYSLRRASDAALREHMHTATSKNQPRLREWTLAWAAWTSQIYLNAYLEKMRPSGLLPAPESHLQTLCLAHMLERALAGLKSALHGHPEQLEEAIEATTRLISAQG